MHSIFVTLLTPLLLTGLTLAVVALGIMTFGQPLLFDRIILATLIGTALISYRFNPNLLGLIAILLAGRLIEEAVWLIRSEHWFFRIGVYTAGLWLCYQFRYTRLAKLTAVVIVLVCFTNLYWQYTDYNAPRLTWSIIILLIDQLVRHIVFLRPHFTARLIKRTDNITWLRADRQLYDLLTLQIILKTLSVAEYLIRHLTGYNLLVIYNAYSYASQILAWAALWAILNQARLIITDRSMRA